MADFDPTSNWITDPIRDVIWSGSSDMGTIDHVNPAFEKLWGRTAEDLYRSSRLLFDGVHPDDKERVRSVMDRGRDTDWIVRCRVVRPDGSTRLVEAHGFAPVEGERAGICRDITELLESQRELESREELLAETGRAAKIGAWELDAETLAVSFDEVLCEIFEIPNGQAPPLDMAIDLYHPDDRPTVRALVKNGLEKGESWDVNLRVVTAKGNLIHVRGRGRAIVEDGRTIKLRGSLQDVTDQVLDRVAMVKSENQLRMILETAPDSIVLMNQDGVVEDWNQAAEEMFGYTAGEAIGRTVAELIIPKQHREAHAAGLAYFNQTGLGPIFGATTQVTAVRSDGSTVPVELAIQGAEESGQRYSVGIMRDVSTRVEQELRLRNAFEGTIEVMARTVESRDPYTAGHQQRVSDLSSVIADRLGMSPDEVLGVSYGAMIHDIGKISVPAEILNRPGKLTRVEFELIKSHAEVGGQIISKVEFPWPVFEIVSQHHERLDGSGYPAGLRGDEISIEARIVAVADVVEAMSSHRPYRAALGVEAALAEITQNRGTLFDPNVVEACLAVFQDQQFEFMHGQIDMPAPR